MNPEQTGGQVQQESDKPLPWGTIIRDDEKRVKEEMDRKSGVSSSDETANDMNLFYPGDDEINPVFSDNPGSVRLEGTKGNSFDLNDVYYDDEGESDPENGDIANPMKEPKNTGSKKERGSPLVEWKVVYPESDEEFESSLNPSRLAESSVLPKGGISVSSDGTDPKDASNILKKSFDAENLGSLKTNSHYDQDISSYVDALRTAWDTGNGRFSELVSYATPDDLLVFVTSLPQDGIFEPFDVGILALKSLGACPHLFQKFFGIIQNILNQQYLKQTQRDIEPPNQMVAARNILQSLTSFLKSIESSEDKGLSKLLPEGLSLAVTKLGVDFRIFDSTLFSQKMYQMPYWYFEITKKFLQEQNVQFYFSEHTFRDEKEKLKIDLIFKGQQLLSQPEFVKLQNAFAFNIHDYRDAWNSFAQDTERNVDALQQYARKGLIEQNTETQVFGSIYDFTDCIQSIAMNRPKFVAMFTAMANVVRFIHTTGKKQTSNENRKEESITGNPYEDDVFLTEFLKKLNDLPMDIEEVFYSNKGHCLKSEDQMLSAFDTGNEFPVELRQIISFLHENLFGSIDGSLYILFSLKSKKDASKFFKYFSGDPEPVILSWLTKLIDHSVTYEIVFNNPRLF